MKGRLLLYGLGISTCSQKVRLCLAEKGLEYEDRPVDLAANEHLEPWYLALNPNGVVPTLMVEDDAIADSSAICEYLDEVWPDPPLSPPDPLQRARMRGMMRYLEEVPTAAIRVPSLNLIFDRSYRGREAEFNELAARRPLRSELYREMGTQGFGAEAVEQSRARLRGALERAEVYLVRDGGPWIIGEMFTLADILLIPTVVRMDDLGMEELWADLPRVSAWYDSVQQRPSFSLAYRPGDRLRPAALSSYRERLAESTAAATASVKAG